MSVPCARADGDPLAVQLAKEQDHPASAIEFRRLALREQNPDARGAYFWSAAFEYSQAGNHSVSDDMLDEAEDSGPGLEQEALLLRGENARSLGDWAESDFYYGGVVEGAEDDTMRAYAARRLAESRFRRSDLEGARGALSRSPLDESDGEAALDAYAEGRDKKPWVGGLLGMIPGFGYFYSGEWASGFRSIILNGLFIYAMVDTAQEDQWGAFTAISFFEFTWYSGSIYGGVDAAHRYNRRRIESCVETMTGGASFEPDYRQLPLIGLQFEF